MSTHHRLTLNKTDRFQTSVLNLLLPTFGGDAQIGPNTTCPNKPRFIRSHNLYFTLILVVIMNAMNALNRYDLYVLEDGEKAVEVIEDTKIPNAATIKVLKQDHTLGNMLRAQLLAMPQILFAGYQVPHPLHPYFLIKIQTDGSITPQALVSEAGDKLIRTLVSLESKFKREFSYKDVEGTVGASVVSGTMITATTTTTSMSTSHLDVDAYGGSTTAGTTAAAAAAGGAWGTGKDYLDL